MATTDAHLNMAQARQDVDPIQVAATMDNALINNAPAQPAEPTVNQDFAVAQANAAPDPSNNVCINLISGLFFRAVSVSFFI